MGNYKSKDQENSNIIVAQNAIGGNNQATVEELRTHAGTTNIILTVMLTLMLLAGVYGLYRAYRRCHTQWIDQQIHHHGLRRSLNRGLPKRHTESVHV